MISASNGALHRSLGTYHHTEINILSATQRECYDVGNFVCDATRMCMNGSRMFMDATPNNIHDSFVIHLCTFMLRRRLFCLRRYTNVHEWLTRSALPLATEGTQECS